MSSDDPLAHLKNGPREMTSHSQSVAFHKLIAKNEAFLSALQKNPMYDAVIDELKGRQIRIGDQWLADFASCNYLGFDLDEEIIQSIPEVVEKWGTHPSWSRMLGSPIMYEEMEEELVDLLGVEDCVIFPNITMISHYCIFILSEGGEIFLDRRSHRTLYEGASVARGQGAKLTVFSSDDFEDLEEKLKASTAHKKLVLVDGVFSMHGQYPDIPQLAALARKYDALLYIDDAHGMGIIGERAEDELCPYGKRGNCIVKYYGESYDNIVMVGGFSKAYSSYSAFLTCSKELKSFLKSVASPYLYTGPAPFASLATALKGLEVNKTRGDQIRLDLYQKSKHLNDAIKKMGLRNDNNTDFPIFNFYLKHAEDVDAVSDFLFKRGIYVTLAPYPMVAKEDVGFRAQITAANTYEEIDHLIAVLKELEGQFEMQKRIPQEEHAGLQSQEESVSVDGKVVLQ